MRTSGCNCTRVSGQDVFLIQTTSSPVNRNIMELLIFLDTLKRASPDRITVLLPYLAYGRSDRKDQPRVPIIARLIADLIGVAGAQRYITLDLHADQIQGFFSIPGDVLTAFPILSDHFRAKRLKKAVVVSADLGFAKKAGYLVDVQQRVQNDQACRTFLGDQHVLSPDRLLLPRMPGEYLGEVLAVVMIAESHEDGRLLRNRAEKLLEIFIVAWLAVQPGQVTCNRHGVR